MRKKNTLTILELTEKIISNLKQNKYSFDLKGHYKSDYNDDSESDFLYHNIINLFVTDFEDEDLFILEKMADLEKIDSYLVIKNDFRNTCPHCGERLTLLSNGIHIKIEHLCSADYTDYSVTIKTPSRKIVIANDLRDFFPEDVLKEDICYDLCTFTGEVNHAIACSTNNLGYIFTGNKNFDLIKSENKLTIKDSEDYSKSEFHIDLWAVCVADYDDLLARMKKYKNLNSLEELDFKYFVFDTNKYFIEIFSHLYNKSNSDVLSIKL